MADEGEAGEDGGTPPIWRREWREGGENKMNKGKGIDEKKYVGINVKSGKIGGKRE